MVMNIKSRLAAVSFHHKQVILVVVINALCLALASVLFFSTNIISFEQSLRAELNSKSLLVSRSTAAALAFHDRDAARALMDAFGPDHTVRQASVFDADHEVFAQYLRPGVRLTPWKEIGEETYIEYEGVITVLQPIELDGLTVGYFFMSADNTALSEQIQSYALIILGVFVLSLFLAYILSLYAQRLMSSPINKLAEIVGHVSEHQNYDRRLQVERTDELGTLINGFNSMLDVIQDREQQLQKNGERLESLVEVRTRQLYQRANYDALTRLPNRHLLMDRLEHGIELAKRSPKNLGVLFLDLDRFKVINDNLGHAIGDELLKKVSARLTSAVRADDSVCRWGGDEFVIFLEHLRRPEYAARVAEKIIQSLKEPFELSGHNLHISTSIGISVYPKDGEDPTTLLKHADISMYQAKDRGAGNYCYFESHMNAMSLERLGMETKLHSALDNNEFSLHYQPQVNLKSGQVMGVEALLRWDNPELGWVSPAEFIPLAEEVGLINRIGLWVLAEACQQNKCWQDQGYSPIRVAVNLSASQLADNNLADDILALLKANELAAQYLEVEITENVFIDAPKSVYGTLQKLRKHGVHISLDDFGTGYSSMSYLRDLPIDTLKVDGGFVRDLGCDAASDGIVQATVTLAHSLGLSVVAECVETSAQRDHLRELNCDMVQGYLFGKPVPPQQLLLTEMAESASATSLVDMPEMAEV
jgi:diguanylate cyclase (GGDEF)-like protein